MNDTPYFDGSNYISLDGQPFPDYQGAYNQNVALVSSPGSAFYNKGSMLYDVTYDFSAYAQPASPSGVMNQGTSPTPTPGQMSGWDWLTPVLGGVVNAAGQIAGIEVQNRVNLASQAAAQRLAAASNKVTPAKPATSDAGWLLPLGLAIGAVLLATRG